jgi:hypothetical protein
LLIIELIRLSNIVTGMAIAGVEVAAGPGGAPSHDVRIAYNRLTGNGLGNNGFGGVRVVNAERIDIIGNFIAEDGGGPKEAAGIYLIDAAHTKAIGNVIMNEGHGGTNGTGIHLAGSGSDLLIENNTIIDDRPAPGMVHGLLGVMPPGTQLLNNTIHGTRGPHYNLRPTPDIGLQASSPAGRSAFVSHAPRSGASETASDADSVWKLTNSDPVDAFSLTLAANPPERSTFTLICGGPITSLAVRANIGQTITGMPRSCVAGDVLRWLYGGSAWKPI